MEFIVHSHRHGETILREPAYVQQWKEIQAALRDIKDADLIKEFEARPQMSLSDAINRALDKRLVLAGWTRQAGIFHDPKYSGKRESRWRLDFAKGEVSIEVAFNHREAIAWNLLKPVMASELNHVEKEIQTSVGVVIAATDELKAAGAFDGAVGTFEDISTYLKPLNNVLTVPMVIIGLKAPEVFRVDKVKQGTRHIGKIRKI